MLSTKKPPTGCGFCWLLPRVYHACLCVSEFCTLLTVICLHIATTGAVYLLAPAWRSEFFLQYRFSFPRYLFTNAQLSLLLHRCWARWLRELRENLFGLPNSCTGTYQHGNNRTSTRAWLVATGHVETITQQIDRNRPRTGRKKMDYFFLAVEMCFSMKILFNR